MASVNMQQYFSYSPDDVWALVADFGGVGKLLSSKVVSSVTADGDEVGCTRWITLNDGNVVEERIEYLDRKERRIIYSIVNKSPLPVSEYVATIKVSSNEEGGCALDWQSTFTPMGNPQQAEEAILGLYQTAIPKIHAQLSDKQPEN